MAKNRIQIEEFLGAYMKAAESGMTREEFASKIGVLPSTVYQRVYEIRRKGYALPSLKCNGRSTLSERIEAVLGGNGAKAKPDGKAKTKGKEPKSEPESDSSDNQEETLTEIFG